MTDSAGDGWKVKWENSKMEEPMTSKPKIKQLRDEEIVVRNPRYRGAAMDDVARALLRRKSREELIAERKAETKSVNPSV